MIKRHVSFTLGMVLTLGLGGATLKACRAVFLLALLVVACASPQPPTSMVRVPDKLKPDGNESLARIVSAKGVQIYECPARKDQIGDPQWESTDGSKILGTVKERADAPVADAIPWLLLAAKSVGSEGSFSKVTSIQRVNTRRRRGDQGRLFSSRGRDAGSHQLHCGYYLFTAK